MGSIIDPLATRLDELAGRHHCGMPDHCDEIAFAACSYAQHAKSGIFIMKRYTFDGARKDFCRRIAACSHRPTVALRANASMHKYSLLEQGSPCRKAK
jgi:hypothetical protein